jgi:hypothetical protein
MMRLWRGGRGGGKDGGRDGRTGEEDAVIELKEIADSCRVTQATRREIITFDYGTEGEK